MSPRMQTHPEETSEETLEIPEAKEEDEAGSESVDGIPAATEDTETSQPEQYEQNTEEEPSLNEYQEELYPEESNESSEDVENTENAADNEQTSGDAGSSSVEGIPAATEDGTYGEGDSIPEDTDEKAYQAEAEVGDGSSDVLNFGNDVPGQEDDLAQYITIKNTGTETHEFCGNQSGTFCSTGYYRTIGGRTECAGMDCTESRNTAWYLRGYNHLSDRGGGRSLFSSTDDHHRRGTGRYTDAGTDTDTGRYTDAGTDTDSAGRHTERQGPR